MSETAELQRLLSQYLSALDRLRPYGIASLPDYAEYAFMQALDGKKATAGQKGHDVTAPRFGRVQVKERRLPADGRIEERLHLGNMTEDGCDWLGAVIFNRDCTVKKATLVPQAEVWRLICQHPDPEKKVRFDLVAALPGARDMTGQLRRIVQ